MEGYYDYHPLADLDRHLVLAGFLTDETRTVGYRLAALTGLPFTDLDRKIEHHAGQSVWDLILNEGETVYRQFEHRQLRRALDDTPPGILTLGDGALIDEANLRTVVERATLVVFDLDLSSCFFRYRSRYRSRDPSEAAPEGGPWHPIYPGPLLGLESIRPFYQQRRGGFDAAHVKIDVRGKNLSQSLDAAFEALPALKPAV